MIVVVFDIDGTLLDSTSAHQEALLGAYASLDVDLEGRPLDSFRHYTDSGVLDQILIEHRGFGVSSSELRELDDYLVGQYVRRSFLANVEQIKGATTLLALLDEDERFAVGFATGGMRSVSEQKLSLLGVDSSVAILTTATEFRSRQEIVSNTVSLATQQAGGSLTAVCVGDGPWDQRTADALELPFVAIESGSYFFDDGPILTESDLSNVTPDVLYHAIEIRQRLRK